MPRKTKTIEVDFREQPVTVYELKVKEVIALIRDNSIGDLDITTLVTFLGTEFLPKVCNLEFKEIEELAPSELVVLYETFMEVNSDFFAVAQKLGINETAKGLIGSLKQALTADFLELYASSLNTGMPESSTTDTPISSSPSTNTDESVSNEKNESQLQQE